MCTFKKVIYKCLKALDCDFQTFLHSKNERIKAQKYSYILEKIFGLSKGSFSLYLNGPYNSKLTDDLYDIANNEQIYIENTAEKPLQNQTIEILNQVRGIITANQNINEVDALELYTTFDYLINNNSFTDIATAFARLKDIKEHLWNKYNNFIEEYLIATHQRIENLLSHSNN